MKSVCVFCGSRFGSDPQFDQDARELGKLIGKKSWRLVYGGGDVGLMGSVASSVMDAGGTVFGIIPKKLLDREVGKQDITELVISQGMFDRKERMIDESDAFVALPGGLGTLDELLEVMTLKQLGYHDKPILLIGGNAFWQPALGLFEHIVRHQFAESSALGFAEQVGSPALAIAQIDNA